MFIQKILSATIELLKRSSSKLKLKFSAIALNASKKRKQTIIIMFVSMFAILNLFVLNTISGQLLVRSQLYSYGSIQIQTIGVTPYSDASCSTPVSSVSWGTLSPGLSSTNIIYLKNEGTSTLTLSLDTTNWYPTNAPNYISLDWNYNGQTLAPNQVIQIILTLSVSQTINGIDSFNFEIIIDGTG